MHICTSTIGCTYNFLTIFSLLSVLNSQLPLSLSLSGAQLSLSLISSIFLPLTSADCHRCRSPSLFIPLVLVVFRLNGLDQWVSGWMGLNVSRHRYCHCLPLEASILFLVLAIATKGIDVNCRSCFSFSPSPPLAFGRVDLVAQGEVSILISGLWSILLGLFFWFFANGLYGFRCDTGVDCGCGSVVVWIKKWIFYLNKCV